MAGTQLAVEGLPGFRASTLLAASSSVANSLEGGFRVNTLQNGALAYVVDQAATYRWFDTSLAVPSNPTIIIPLGQALGTPGRWILVSADIGPVGPAGGDLSGEYPDPEVVAFHSGVTRLTIGAIPDNELLLRSGGSIVSLTRTFSGELTGTYPSAGVVKTNTRVVDASVGTVQDLVPGGNAALWDAATFAYLNNATALSIGGFARPLTNTSPRFKVLSRIGAGSATLLDNAGGSTAQNRIRVASSNATMSGPQGIGGYMVYDDANSVWVATCFPTATAGPGANTTATTASGGDNVTPGPSASAWDASSLLIFTNAAPITINGLAPPLTPNSPHIKYCVQGGAGTVTFADNAGTSTAGWRFRVGTPYDVMGIGPGIGAALIYDTASTIWRVMGGVGSS